MNFKEIEGGVVAPKGFLASGVHCGMRRNKTKRDLSIILSDVLCNSACVYTTNKLQGAPIKVTKENLKNGKAKAIVCNSGNANTCNKNGIEIAKEICDLVANELNINKDDVIVASTGVIGEEFPIEPIKLGIPKLKKQITKDIVGNKYASDGILTMDLISKTTAIEFMLDGKLCKIGTIAKGSGMIHPNMATTLCFITTDVNISSKMLQKALSLSVNKSFNMISVDGDTSCNDMVSILASGLAGNNEINYENENFDIFCKALDFITDKMAKLVATDGEGATKVLVVNIKGAENDESAKIIAKTVSTSTLVKTSMFGIDANWGRIICAVGYSDTEIDMNKVCVEFVSKNGSLLVCKDGYGVPYEYDIAKNILDTDEVFINITVGNGSGNAVSYGCDFSYDFIKISANYKKATKMNISNIDKADVLINALPYIQKYNNKVVVIKYGGNAMINQELKEAVIDDLILLSLVGVKVVLVHGGGPEINEALAKVGKEPKFVNGLRYTDSETMDIVQMILAGKINKNLVSLIENHKGKAIGLCGIDGGMIKAVKKQSDVDLGLVGDIEKINVELITDVLAKGYIPVIATIGIDDNGVKYNINADTAASRIASSLNAENIILLTDTRGLLEDKDDEYTLIPKVPIDSVPKLMSSGIVSGGMIPKVECCVDAVRRGVSKSFIIDGRIPHSILIEMMTNEGIGTMFTT